MMSDPEVSNSLVPKIEPGLFDWSVTTASDDAASQDAAEGAPSTPATTKSGGVKKKRRVDHPRDFKPEWEMELLFARNHDGKPICLTCGFVVCTNKRFNIERHYRSLHRGMDEKLPKSSTARHQFVFAKKHELGLVEDVRSDSNPSHVLNMFLARSKIDVSLQPNFVQTLLATLADLVPDEMSKKILNDLCIGPTEANANIAAIIGTLHEELKYLAFKSVGFSLTLHVLTNFLGIRYISVLVRTVDEHFNVNEDFVLMKPVPVDTNSTPFAVQMLTELEDFDWCKLISISTNLDRAQISQFLTSKNIVQQTIFTSFTLFDICNQLQIECLTKVVFKCLRNIQRLQPSDTARSSVYAKMLQDFQASNVTIADTAKLFQAQFDVLPVLSQFLLCLDEVKQDIVKLCDLKQELQRISDPQWVGHLALVSDLLPHIEKLRVELHNQDNSFEGLYSAVKSFHCKLQLFERQLHNKDFAHFSNVCRVISTNDSVVVDLQSHLKNVHQFMVGICESLDVDGPYLDLVCNPFAISENTIDQLDSEYQIETLDIRNPIFKLTYEDCQRGQKNYLVSFWKRIQQEEFHALRLLALKFMARFANTFLLDHLSETLGVLNVTNKGGVGGAELTHLMSLAMTSYKPRPAAAVPNQTNAST